MSNVNDHILQAAILQFGIKSSKSLPGYVGNAYYEYGHSDGKDLITVTYDQKNQYKPIEGSNGIPEADCSYLVKTTLGLSGYGEIANKINSTRDLFIGKELTSTAKTYFTEYDKDFVTKSVQLQVGDFIMWKSTTSDFCNGQVKL